MFSPAQRLAFAAVHPGVRSRRGQYDGLYAMRAVEWLAGMNGTPHPDYWWLFWPTGRRRRGLLVELGRLDDPELAREMAAILCRKQPRAKAGAAWVRRYRLGRRDLPDPEKLAAVLVRAVRRYADVHPGLTTRQTFSALFHARRIIGRGEGAPPPAVADVTGNGAEIERK